MLGDAIESGKKQEIEFDVSQQNAQCPVECKLPLRWSLLCRHWIYPVFVDKTFIPCSLIHLHWFFDGPKRI